MNQIEWDALVQALHDRSDVTRAVGAAQRLQKFATREDVPRLVALLANDAFFVREAAAWPLSDLGVTEALPQLLEAVYRGIQECHDNDGLNAALADLAEMNPSPARAALNGIVATGPEHLRAHALSLLEFCTNETDA